MNGKDNVTDFVLKYIDKWDEQTDYGEDVSRLEDWEKNAYYVDNMNSEVHSAGFAGYLTSNYYPGKKQLIEALSSVKATNTLLIFKKVIKKFPLCYIPKNIAIREKILIDWEIIKLDDLDNEFYEYQDNLEVMVRDYIVEHIDN